MNRSDIFNYVSDIIDDNFHLYRDIKERDNIKNDLGFDSLDIIELIMDMEVFFDICIPDSEVIKMHTISDVVDYLENEL